MNTEDKLKEIINHYGVNHQLKKLNEEIFELIEAVMNYRTIQTFNPTEIYITKGIEAVTEEIADCYVMLEQFRLLYEITDEEIKNIMELKIDRQLERIANEK